MPLFIFHFSHIHCLHLLFGQTVVILNNPQQVLSTVLLCYQLPGFRTKKLEKFNIIIHCNRQRKFPLKIKQRNTLIIEIQIVFYHSEELTIVLRQEEHEGHSAVQ